MHKAIKLIFDISVWTGFALFLGGLFMELPQDAKEKVYTTSLDILAEIIPLI